MNGSAFAPGRTEGPVAESRRGRVLVGVSGSESSLAALRWAARFADHRGWPLEVLAAWPDDADEFVHAVPGHHCAPMSHAVENVDRALEQTPLLAEGARDVDVRIENAHPAQALLDRCDSTTVLVLGASHNAGQDVIGGCDVAHVCACLAPCPVVLVDVEPLDQIASACSLLGVAI